MEGPNGAKGGAPRRWLQRRDRALVLYVMQLPDFSGAEIVQLPLLQADSHALLACPPGSRVDDLGRSLGIATVALPFRSLRHSGGLAETIRSVGRGLLSARDMRRLLRARPERTIVYCTQLRPAMVVALAQVGLRRRSVWVVTDFMPPAPLRHVVRLLARATCAAAITHSKAVAEDFAGRSPYLVRRTRVLPPGLDLARFSPERARPGAPHAAVIGHVSSLKRTDLALDIAARVAAVEPAFRLDVIGRAQFRDENVVFERELHDRVAGDERLRPIVSFRGFVEDVPGELPGYGLVLHCCPVEGFGMVLVEAMAAGLPVVAARAGGPIDIVEHGVTGFLYDPGDDEAAAGYVLTLLRDRTRAADMGAAARRRAERLYSADEQVRALEDLLGSVASPRSVGRRRVPSSCALR